MKIPLFEDFINEYKFSTIQQDLGENILYFHNNFSKEQEKLIRTYLKLPKDYDFVASISEWTEPQKYEKIENIINQELEPWATVGNLEFRLLDSFGKIKIVEYRNTYIKQRKTTIFLMNPDVASANGLV